MNFKTILSAFFLLVAPVFADVNDGETYTLSDGTTVNFGVTVASTMNTADITITTDTGGITNTTGVPGSGGEKNPSVSDMPVTTCGGKKLKIEDGKLKEQKANGKWITVKKSKVVKQALSEDTIGTGPRWG